MSDGVAVVGEGLLADFVCAQLSSSYKVIRQTEVHGDELKSSKLVLVLSDEWNPSESLKTEEVLHRGTIPWLCGFVAWNEGVVGPLVRPGIPGCSQCAEMRRQMAGSEREETLELQMELLTHGKVSLDPAVSRIGLQQMACLIAAEAQKVLGGERAQTEGRVYVMSLNTLEVSLHPFLPDPLCPVCGECPDDSPELVRVSLQPSPKHSPDSFRCRTLESLAVKNYLDDRTGLLNGKTVDLASPFASVIVNLPSFMGGTGAAGRTHSYTESERTAILEGLERYCGISPRGKRGVVHDTFCNVSEQALDPFKVGVYSKEQYAQPDFPFEPFDPDRPIDWVWGYSLIQERPILVPASLAYYSAGFGDAFVNEGSNGCALGGSLEEAIFYGMLEVVERDSFLITWYAQLPAPRLDPLSVQDIELQLMFDRLRAAAGYDVHLFNTTMEHGIPSVWAVAKNRGSTGAHLICAAGAHVDPVRAVKSAVHELAGMIPMLGELLAEGGEECARMLQNPSLVREMGDHSMLYGLPQAEARLQFLLEESLPLRSFDEEFKRRERHADLTDDLKELLQVFKRLGLDVMVVDQSTPETLKNGLYCVKVLMPGMLPMTFGHQLTRLTGLDRVLSVPVTLGYAKQRLTRKQLNPHPHPFP